MCQPKKGLKPNPFISLRDPNTGEWKVIFNFCQEYFGQEHFGQEPMPKEA